MPRVSPSIAAIESVLVIVPSGGEFSVVSSNAAVMKLHEMEPCEKRMNQPKRHTCGRERSAIIEKQTATEVLNQRRSCRKVRFLPGMGAWFRQCIYQKAWDGSVSPSGCESSEIPHIRQLTSFAFVEYEFKRRRDPLDLYAECISNTTERKEKAN